MKKAINVFMLLVLGLIWITGCTSSRDQVVARIGGDKITVSELADQYIDLKKNAPIKIDEGLSQYEDLKRFLEQRIDSRLMLQVAYEEGFNKDPEIVERVSQEKDKILVNSLISREILDKIKITEKDVRDFYEKTGERAKIRHILVKTQEEAEEAYKALKKGADFDSLVRKISIDLRTQNKGGDLGFITWYSMVGSMEFKEVAFNLEPQEISRPVKSFFGWHIIKLDEKRKDPPQKSFEEERERMRMNLQMLTQQDLGINYMMNLMENSKIKIVSSTNEMLKRKLLLLQREDTLATSPQEINIDPTQLTEEERALPFLRYRGGELSVDEFLRFYNQWPSFQRPPLEDEDGLRNMVFNQLLATEILIKEAQQKGMDKSKEYKNKLKNLEERLVAEKFRNEVLWKEVIIEQADLENFYQENKYKYIDPAQAHILEILVKTKKEAQNLLQKLKAGADFKELAKEKTLRTLVKDKGGDIGIVTRGTDPELFEAAFKLKEGEIGGPVHLLKSPAGEGYSIIKLLEKKEQKQRTLEEVESQVRSTLIFNKKNKLSMKWVAEQRAKTDIHINQSAFEAALKIVQKELPQDDS